LAAAIICFPLPGAINDTHMVEKMFMAGLGPGLRRPNLGAKRLSGAGFAHRGAHHTGQRL
jgi:hypothetical protein